MRSVITLFVNRKFNNSLKVPVSVQSLYTDTQIAITQTPGLAQLPFRVSPCASAAFENG